MKITVIITGVTGMVGEGVLIECLANPDVERVLMVNRKHYEASHPKQKSLLFPIYSTCLNLPLTLPGIMPAFSAQVSVV